ncbi:serine hydrolase domain-containing protein [Catenulispora rubra]|uniref:serine hydrolase domain-containing protein n=1 Tax=Catenulispora rubra TaxID=280293 RepID=UPI0018926FBD|nr:serine hydrolase domain-containing protein [Catenulispora rubra]
MATDLQELLQSAVDDGKAPGVVALVARGDDVEIATAGTTGLGGSAPMARDTLFRIASLTKPITAALALLLIEEGRIGHDDPIARWLPELAHPMVVRTPDAPLDDVIPAVRPITVADVLTSRAGWGFPDEFSLPAVGALFDQGYQRGLHVQEPPAPDEWLKSLAGVPLVYQPGERWLYNTCSEILGVLLARAADTPLPELMAERIFDPLGMKDTAFEVPAANLDRFTWFYESDDSGLVLADPPTGDWSRLPAFPSGAGGLVSTLDDYHAFARTLLPGTDGLLSPESVREMITDHLTADQRAASRLFLDGQGWGVGGSVDIADIDPWNIPGRYGWTGGSGTSAHIVPGTGSVPGSVAILLSQVAMGSPTALGLQRDFWTYAARG